MLIKYFISKLDLFKVYVLQKNKINKSKQIFLLKVLIQAEVK